MGNNADVRMALRHLPDCRNSGKSGIWEGAMVRKGPWDLRKRRSWFILRMETMGTVWGEVLAP